MIHHVCGEAVPCFDGVINVVHRSSCGGMLSGV